MKKRDGAGGTAYLILTIGALLLVMPFVYMILTSLKNNVEASDPNFSFWVKHPTIEPFRKLFDAGKILSATWNSLQIAVLTTLGNMYLGALAGYAFAKHKFPGRDVLLLVLLSTMMIPGAILLVPGFLLFRDLGWLDDFKPLIIPGICGSFSVFLARQFITTIPDSLIEAAKIEGCSEGQIFLNVILPNSKSLLSTIGILTFLGSWNSFLGPLIILFTDKKYTLQLEISMLQGRFPGQENTQMAGAMVSIVPVLLIFFLLQRQIVQSLASSGLKEG